MKQILAKKIGMTQIMAPDGKVTPVTVWGVNTCQITQIKTPQKDGYAAIQVGVETLPERKANKPRKGHFQSAGHIYRMSREFRMDSTDGMNVGDYLVASMFETGDKVNVAGLSIGKGFQGTIKRWNFARGPMSHGSKSHRIPGSIGGHTEPGRVFKGKKMAGQMGHERVTVKNLEVVQVDEDGQIILVKGAVPGPKGGIIELKAPGDLKTVSSLETPPAKDEEAETKQTLAETSAEEPIVEEATLEQKEDVKDSALEAASDPETIELQEEAVVEPEVEFIKEESSQEEEK